MTKKQERELIFNKTNGRCGYCGNPLKNGWHIDHMKPVVRDFKYCRKKQRHVQTGVLLSPENDVFENKIASCPSCNIRKSSLELEGFRHSLQHTIQTLNNDHSAYIFAKRYGLIKETNIDIKFYFETLNNEPKTEP